MAIFELDSALASGTWDLAVGPWSTAPRIAAFDAGGPSESLWRVDLARDLAASRTALAGGERSVTRTHAVLDEAAPRFDRALEYTLAQRAGASGSELARWSQSRPISSAAPEFPQIESSLIAALAGADDDSQPSTSPPSWTAGSPADAQPAREPGWIDRALDQIADLARGRARIETRVEGALVAHSIMTLSGDTDVWIAPQLSLAGASLHARSVAVAVRTRHAWARILTLIAGACGRIVTLGLPAGGAAALPLVWRFMRDLLRETHTHRQYLPHTPN